jgi:hypothetical protein
MQWLMYSSSHGCHSNHCVLHGMYYDVTCKYESYGKEDGGGGGGGLEGRPILVRSCCGDYTSVPNTFTILGLFNIFLPPRAGDFGAFSA